MNENEDEDDLYDGLEFILDDECNCPMLSGGFIMHTKSCPYMINKYGL